MPQAIINSFITAPVTPASFPNLVLWYRGDYQAWAGGSPVPDNTQIDFWGEMSAGVANAAQGVAADQPLFQSAELNGQDVIEFQGTGADIRNLVIADADLPSFAGVGELDYSIFAVIKFTDVSPATLQMIFTKNLTNVATEVPEFRLFGGKMELAEDFPNAVASTVGPSAGVWYAMGGVRDEGAATLRHYLNGAPNGSGARGTSAVNASSAFIGRRVDGFTLLDVYIAELLVYKRAFTDADALSLQAYFAARYGL